MSAAIENYRKMVDQPWGRMFYDLVYRQLDIPDDRRVKILDFGAGFCLTADHYAKHHDVIALEPNEEMINARVRNNGYTLIPRGLDYLRTIEENAVDVVICHNVLEYADDRQAVLKEFVRVLKPQGVLSIVKHNALGRAMACAVLNDEPQAALDLLNKDGPESSMFGNRSVYDNMYLVDFLADAMSLAGVYGIRTFYGLSANNEIKFTDTWYEAMLALEQKAGAMEEYQKISFFNHLIFEKRKTRET